MRGKELNCELQGKQHQMVRKRKKCGDRALACITKVYFRVNIL
jgi:hypothetical protein